MNGIIQGLNGYNVHFLIFMFSCNMLLLKGGLRLKMTHTILLSSLPLAYPIHMQYRNTGDPESTVLYRVYIVL